MVRLLDDFLQNQFGCFLSDVDNNNAYGNCQFSRGILEIFWGGWNLIVFHELHENDKLILRKSFFDPGEINVERIMGRQRF